LTIIKTLTIFSKDKGCYSAMIVEFKKDCMSKRHQVSAQDAYLRATNYYQNGAAFYLDINPSDSCITSTREKGVESFRKAIGLLSRKAETIEIPYEGTTLPGYFFSISQRGMIIITMTIL
jgi:hypothetical protein